MLGYHSILITLVRVTLHFYSFEVRCCLSLLESVLMGFEDTANELLSFACVLQDTGVNILLGLPTDTQRPPFAPTPIVTSHAALLSATHTPWKREPHEPLETQLRVRE